MANLTVSKNGGTITVAVSSTPSSNSRSYGTLPSYTSRSGDVITVSANTSYDREFNLSVTATTASDPAYQGTATAYSAWTVSQAGELGPQPSTPNFTMRNSSSTYGLYGTFTTSPDVSLDGDWAASKYENEYNPVPFTITSFTGAVTRGSTTNPWPSNVVFSVNGSNYYFTVQQSPEGAVVWSGSITISQGDSIVISFN